MRRGLAALCVWVLASAASATVTPQPGGGDPRIQSVEYDPQQVVALKVAPDNALTLEFSPEERIENVALGSSSGWLVTPNKSADHLFIKAAQGALNTDMTVITDVRSYNFELHLAPGPDATTAMLIRFRYPAPAVLREPVAQPATSYYRFSGDRSLHPVDMRDDGYATYIIWNVKTPIPAIFIVETDGRYTLADSSMRDGRLVIDRTADEFVFRLGPHEEHAHRHVRKVRPK